MLENHRLRVFRAVAGHMSFSRAAEQLLLTQPAVTQQIKALEDELGFPLFDRGGGRLSLTKSGEILLPFAEKISRLSNEAAAAAAQEAGDELGELSIGASLTIAQYLLPNLVAHFLKSYPKVKITVHTENSDEALESLIAKKVQLALIEGPERRKDLNVQPFMEDHLVLVVPVCHEWADQEITVQDLSGEPLLLREFGSGTRRSVEVALTEAGLNLKDLRFGMEFDSTEGLLSSVEAGLGVTILSRWAVRNQLALGTLKIARVAGLKLRRQFSMAYPAGPEPGGAVGAFRNLLLAHAEEFAPRATGRRQEPVFQPKGAGPLTKMLL